MDASDVFGGGGIDWNRSGTAAEEAATSVWKKREARGIGARVQGEGFVRRRSFGI